MFIQRLFNQGNAPLLEQVVRFSAARHTLIAENIANVDTPGYRQRDLAVDKFNALLRDRVDVRRSSPPGSVGFDDVGAELDHPRQGILFHDGNNRSIEHLATDLAKNALTHNMAVELLRRQYTSIDNALKERVV
jgi:flagellar basal-body rod protein FlgB